jgi:O-antigen/teichoic acid export membrane protein
LTNAGDIVQRSGRSGQAWRSFCALGAGNYAAIAVGLAVNVLITRRLGTEQYGRLALMLVASQVLLLAAVNWSHAGFVRFGAVAFASDRVANRTLWTRMGLVLPTAAAGVLIAARGHRELAAYLNIPPAGVWLILLHFLAAGASSIIGAVLQASSEMARFGVSLFLDKTLTLVALFVLPPAWTANPLVVLSCYAFSSLAVAIWGASIVGRRALRPVRPALSDLRAMVLFSAPMFLSGWAGFLGANWFDLIILEHYMPIDDVGVYALAAQLAGVVQQVTIIFSTLALPHLSVMVAEGQHAHIRTFMSRLLPYWLLGTSVLFSLVVLGARFVVPLAFGRAFTGAAPVLALLMVGASAMALFNSCAPLVTAYGSTWIVTGTLLMLGFVNVGLDLMLIPRLGAAGSALATALSWATAALLVLLFLQKRLGGQVLRLVSFAAPVLAAYSCFLLLDGVWFYAATPIAAAAAALALVGLFRLFDDEDAVFLKELRVPMPSALDAVLGRRS